MSDETETKDPVVECSVSAVAAALDVSERRVQQLEKEGVVVKVRHGVYDLVASARNYLEVQTESKVAFDAKEQHELEKVRWTKARADKEEANLALLRGEIVLVEDAAKLLSEEAGSIRAAWEGQESALITDLSNRVLTEAEVAMALRRARDDVFEKLTLDTDKPRTPRTKNIPKEFLSDDDSDFDGSIPSGDEGKRPV